MSKGVKIIIAAVVIFNLATTGVIGYGAFWFNSNHAIRVIKKGNEIVEVDKEHVEIVENCAVQLGPCNLILKPMEDYTIE